jgi:eukaryotic-like serine/threonine-protein kinase
MTLRMLLATQPVLPLAQSARFFAQLCRETERRLAQAEPLWLHPSAVHVGPDGRPAIGGQDIPSDPRDVACLAPESVATRTPADARSAVYAIGAMFYESVTGTPVGPQMKRPAELGMPALADTLLARALAPDAQKRPADLGALASAFDQLAATAPTAAVAAAPQAPSTSLPPDGYDVAFSMAPPPGMEVAPPSAPQSAPQSSRNPVPAAAASSRSLDPFGNVIVAAPPPSARAVKPTATQELTELKARLEADPTPRYVVSKDKMDHGPFNAVELLQQIASHTFEGHHGLRDEVTGQDRTIDEWPEFARFAEHARIHREVVAEKKAVVQLEKDEKKAGIAKYLIGSAVALGLAAASVIVIVKVRGTHREGADIVDDPSAMDLNVDGGLKGRKTAGGGGGKGGAGGGGGGGYARGGQSYESALASNNQEVNIGGGGGGPDLTDNQLAAPMRNATFIGGCGAPNDMKVTVRVAIKMGRAVGVSVYTNPADGAVASCVDRHVRGLAWPANGKMDSFTTTY